jgi:aspartokinase
MVTIAHIVEKRISEMPFIEEALARGIINNAALAEEMTPEIERELKKKVKFSAVNMAIRRLAEKLSKSFVNKVKFDSSSNISLRSGLIAFSLHKGTQIQDSLKKIYDIIDINSGDFLTITQGLNEIFIITNKKYENKILEIIPQRYYKGSYKELASITIHIPQSSVEVPGLFYLATRELLWENINILDIISTVTEMTFIVKENDTSKAFEALNRMLKKTKE